MYPGNHRLMTPDNAQQAEPMRLASVLETQREMICRFLPDTTLTFVNQAYCQMFGRSANELIGRKFLELVPPSERELIQSQLALVTPDSPTATYTRTALKKDGTRVWQEWTDHAILDSGDRIRELQSVGRDITAQKQAERALFKANRLQEEVLNGITDIIGVQNPDMTMIRYNKAGYETLGLTPAQVIGQNCYNLIGRNTPCEDCATRRAVASKKLESTERYVPELNRYFLCRSNPVLDEHRNVTLIVEQLHDTTERRRMEHRTRQLHKANSLNRMAGATAHHYNNMLSAIMGNLELALLQMPASSGTTANLSDAMEAAQHGAEVGRQLLAYLGQNFGRRKPLNLSETCWKYLDSIRDELPDGLLLDLQLESPGPVIIGNSGEIRQILSNLCDNAREALTNGTGSISVRVQTVFFDQVQSEQRFPVEFQPHSGSYVCLEVADTGCGIAESDVEKIFDPFYSTNFTGRGLGLATVLGSVKAHDGCVTIASSPGYGTVLAVYLPLAEKPASVPTIDGSATASLPEGIILLVEDDPAVRRMATRMLQHLGFSVLPTGDGQEALELFRARHHEIDCVLCDLTMPRLNGWQTLEALHALVPGVLVILTSGYDEKHVMEGIHTQLPQTFLRKPYSLVTLRQALEQALKSRSEFKQPV